MQGIFVRTLIIMLGLFLASRLLPGVWIEGTGNFILAGFWSALFGAIIVSITSTVASWYIGPDGRYEVFVVRRR